MKNGCHNRPPLAREVMVQSGWTIDGRRLLVPIPVPMTPDCQYTHSELGKVDMGCACCNHRYNRQEKP